MTKKPRVQRPPIEPPEFVWYVDDDDGRVLRYRIIKRVREDIYVSTMPFDSPPEVTPENRQYYRVHDTFVLYPALMSGFGAMDPNARFEEGAYQTKARFFVPRREGTYGECTVDGGKFYATRERAEAMAEAMAHAETHKRIPPGATWGVVLGLSGSCSVEMVKEAYRRLARDHHPDRGGKPRDFTILEAAYREALAYIDRAWLFDLVG